MGIIGCHDAHRPPSYFDENYAVELRRVLGRARMDEVTPDDHWEAVKELDGGIILAFDAPACGFVIPDECVASYVACYPDKPGDSSSVDPSWSEARERVDSLEWARRSCSMPSLGRDPISSSPCRSGIRGVRS